MVATARVTVLMEHAQKARLAERAKIMGLSVGEYIRSKALDEEGHEALLDEVRASTARANAALDRVLALLQRSQEQAAANDDAAIRARARREFAGVDFAALADWLDHPPAPSFEPQQLLVAETRGTYR